MCFSLGLLDLMQVDSTGYLGSSKLSVFYTDIHMFSSVFFFVIRFKRKKLSGWNLEL